MEQLNSNAPDSELFRHGFEFTGKQQFFIFTMYCGTNKQKFFQNNLFYAIFLLYFKKTFFIIYLLNSYSLHLQGVSQVQKSGQANTEYLVIKITLWQHKTNGKYKS